MNKFFNVVIMLMVSAFAAEPVFIPANGAGGMPAPVSPFGPAFGPPGTGAASGQGNQVSIPSALSLGSSTPAALAPNETEEKSREKKRTANAWSWFSRSQEARRLGENILKGMGSNPRPVTADYLIQPGDIVRIVAWGGATINVPVPIDAAGNLPVPEFGMVPVMGKTAMEAQVLVTNLLRSFLKNAGCVIGVEQSQAVPILVTGEVRKAGPMVIPAGAGVVEALSIAEVLDQGSLRQIRVTRPGGKPEMVDVYRILLDGELEGAKSLPSGTIVHVPLAGPHVLVFGSVRRAERLSTAPLQGSGLQAGIAGVPRPADLPPPKDQFAGVMVELLPGQRLDEAIKLSGGMEMEADPMQIRLAREEDQGQLMSQWTLEQLASMPAKSGDRLLVPERTSIERRWQKVQVLGSVRTPGLYPLPAKARVQELLELTGGLLPEADPDKIMIRRRLSKSQGVELMENITLPAYETLIGPVAMDALIEPGDVVTVLPKTRLEDSTMWVAISGAVLRPGKYPLLPGMRVWELLLLAGDVQSDARLEITDLIRLKIDGEGRTNAERSVIDLRPVITGKDFGPLLKNQDQIVVRRRQDERVKFTVMGEVSAPGEYILPSGTTLGQAMRIIGGMTPRAFPQGAKFFRMAEKDIQNEHLRHLAERLQSTVAVNERQSATIESEKDQKDFERTLNVQRAELTRIQTATATGRLSGIRLNELSTEDKTQDLLLADGDRIEIPIRPGSIRILGEVNTPGSLIWSDGIRPEQAIALSGGFTRQADKDLMFVVKADGSVVSNENSSGVSWDPRQRRYVRSRAGSLVLAEGDAVIVPPDLRYTPSNLSLLRDWTQVLFQIAATAGTVAVLAR